MRRYEPLLAMVVVLSPFVAAQDQLQLVRKVAANYRALPKTNYDFEMIEVRDSPGSFRNVVEQRRRISGSGGKYRTEGLPTGLLYVFDGQFRWSYNPDRKEYTKTSAASSAGHAGELSMFEIADYRATSARLLRHEALELATGPVMCQVIEVDHAPNQDGVLYSPMTYWIDETRNLVLRMTYKVTIQHADQATSSESNISVSFIKAIVGPLVDQELFRFTPPADAVQVETLEFGPRSPVAGKEVPNFALKGADGKAITGSSLRGNVVLLQFSPQMDDKMLIFAEMANRSFAGNGLTTLYILPLRSRSDVGSMSHTVPVAFDDGSAANAFGVHATGTVLIDRSGKVTFVDVSYQDWLKLARILQKEGVW